MNPISRSARWRRRPASAGRSHALKYVRRSRPNRILGADDKGAVDGEPGRTHASTQPSTPERQAGRRFPG